MVAQPLDAIVHPISTQSIARSAHTPHRHVQHNDEALVRPPCSYSRNMPRLAPDIVQLQLLHALLRGHGSRYVHLGGGHRLSRQLAGQLTPHALHPLHSQTLFTKKTTGIDIPEISGWSRRFCSSSFATHILNLSVLSNTNIMAWDDHVTKGPAQPQINYLCIFVIMFP